MAFSEEPTRTPNAIGAIDIKIHTTGPSGAGGAVDYSVKIVFSDGSVVVRSGDLLPHLSQAQINGLISFMNDMRTKAESEFLP